MNDTSEEELKLKLEEILDVFGHQVINKEFGGDRVILKREPMRRMMQLIKAYGLQCKIDEVVKMPISGSIGVIYRYKRDRRAILIALKKGTGTSNE